MHKYLRAIGFAGFQKKAQIDKEIDSIIKNPSETKIVEIGDGRIFCEKRKEVSKTMGIAVRGELIEQDQFSYEYYYPYFIDDKIAIVDEILVEKYVEKEAYAGVCDNINVGINLIYYLQNVSDYLTVAWKSGNRKFNTGTALSALSVSGTIIFPMEKSEEQIRENRKAVSNRNSLLEAARDGDENAIENLTLEDMDTYTMLSRRIQKEDILSIVDTSFMPYGIESDQYSIIGEILQIRTEENRITKENMFLLTVFSNNLLFELCINQEDLYGEPAVGRRFKGEIWLQGRINFGKSM